jgi:hypothetical protein
METHAIDHMLEVFCKEVVIFEEPQDTQVIDNAKNQVKLFVFLRIVDEQSENIIYQCRQDQEQHKPPVPPSIKEVAGQ